MEIHLRFLMIIPLDHMMSRDIEITLLFYYHVIFEFYDTCTFTESKPFKFTIYTCRRLQNLWLVAGSRIYG